jgi:hypothetical protein
VTGTLPRVSPRLRARAVNTLVLAGAIAVALGVVEIVLRARPTLLGQAFANGVLSKYSDREGGIFYKDRQAQMRFMIPEFTTSMYANGYVWTHRTDALGFRNPRLSMPTDIVLLGDSYIYGHGVEVESTVGVILERLTGLSVANLARQGDCALQQAYLAAEFLPVFRPRYVFYFFFENDLGDLYALIGDDAMRAYIEQPPESIRHPARLDRAQALQEHAERLARQSWIRRLKRASYTYKAFKWLQWNLGARPAEAGPPRRVPELEGADSLAWQYTRKAIRYMDGLSRRHGARFVIVPITPNTPRLGEILRDFAREAAIDFVDTADLTMRADLSLWLPGDGHLSAAGARRFAERAAAYVAARPPIAQRTVEGGVSDR